MPQEIQPTTAMGPEMEEGLKKFRREVNKRMAARISMARKEKVLIASMSSIKICSETLPKHNHCSSKTPIESALGPSPGAKIRKSYRPYTLTPLLRQPPRRLKRVVGNDPEEGLFEVVHLWILNHHKRDVDESSIMRKEKQKLVMKEWQSRVAMLRSIKDQGEIPTVPKRTFSQMTGEEYTNPVEPRETKKTRTSDVRCEKIGMFEWAHVMEFEVKRLLDHTNRMSIGTAYPHNSINQNTQYTHTNGNTQEVPTYVPLLSLPEKDTRYNEVDVVDVLTEGLSLGDIQFKTERQRALQSKNPTRITTPPRSLPQNKLGDR